MPERPKRRKNNKNKRKNKNNRPDLNKDTSDVTESGNIESCSVSNIDLDNDNTVAEDVSENEIVNITPSTENQVHLDSQDTTDNISGNIQSSSQDLNNNSNDVPTSSNEIINLTKEDHDSEELSDDHIIQNYVVESPDHSIKSKPKLSNSVKSKSLDNDDDPKITEITEEYNTQSEDDNTLAIIDSSNVIVSDAESDVEWEKTDVLKEDKSPPQKEFATGKMSITTVPLTVAQCDQTKSLTPEEESSLRHYLQTLNLSTHPVNSIEIKTEIEQIINREIKHRLRKKGLAEDFFSQRLGPPRMLDVIDEEGSSESSVTSRRQSYLSDKKSDNEDLDDDVFEDSKKLKEKYSSKTVSNKNFGRLIPQECVLVGAKIKEPEITEARGDWTMKTVEKMAGAEVVYLTDSSSSTSSLYDVGEEANENIETDVSVRMITPTIEVTDTENFLKKTFIKNEDIVKTEQTNTQSEKNTNARSENIVDHIDKLSKFSDSVENTPNSHEIVVLSTDNIKTNLYVKDLSDSESKQKTENTSKLNESINDTLMNTQTTLNKNSTMLDQNSGSEYNLEIKVLKCELNDAINNLIKEVVSDSENNDDNSKETFTRQDSSSSVCSSQCTAKYNPTNSSLNDVSNILHDEHSASCDMSKTNTEVVQKHDVTSHVKDVFECVTGKSTQYKNQVGSTVKQPLTLRDLCVRKIATFPFGDKILEELASVSERLQNISIQGTDSNIKSQKQLETVITKEEKTINKMPYFPSLNVSSVDKLSVPIKRKESVPPPVQPRHSSLKKSHDDSLWTSLPTKTEPAYVCLSPSQKMLMEKTNTIITKEDTSKLVDMHKKVNHGNYNEFHNKKEEREIEQTDLPPIAPFKSQTGSRLLALIQDPTVTNNINSTINKHYNKSLDQLHTSSARPETTSKRDNEQFKSFRDTPHTFKPIPPPRPRKFSSSIYESDEGSDFIENSLRSMKTEKKIFHYSTGNLSKEIENDISSIQNMHRYYSNKRDQMNYQNNYPRRPSLPKDLCDQQMEYIRQKEKEVEAEIRRLENQNLNVPSLPKRGPRAPLLSEKELIEEKVVDANNYSISRKKDVTFSTTPEEKMEKGKLSSLFSSSQEEILREKMYSEYINQMAERQERKQQKIIKISNTPSSTSDKISKSMSALDILDSKVNNRIEKEFISKARERWNKLGIKDPETEDEKDEASKYVYREPKVIEHKIKVIEGGEEKDVQNLPSHLQDFVRFTAKDKEQGTGSPGESETGPASPHVVILCAVIILVIAVGKYFLQFLRKK